jgi:hypothetical protein
MYLRICIFLGPRFIFLEVPYIIGCVTILEFSNLFACCTPELQLNLLLWTRSTFCTNGVVNIACKERYYAEKDADIQKFANKTPYITQLFTPPPKRNTKLQHHLK